MNERPYEMLFNNFMRGNYLHSMNTNENILLLQKMLYFGSKNIFYEVAHGKKYLMLSFQNEKPKFHQLAPIYIKTQTGSKFYPLLCREYDA